MKKTILFLFIFVSCQAIAFAITDREQKRIAMSKLGTDGVEIIESSPSYSIVQSTDGRGYAIIDLRDGSKGRILAFSTEGRWQKDEMPPIVLSWLTKIGDKRTAGVSNSRYLHGDWPSVPPLLTCHWHQRSPYNDLAPVIEDGNIKTVAGCVAIAAAQITYYWRKDNPPYTLKDTPTYIYGGAPVTMSIPKGSPNNWELMLDTYTADDSPESRAAAAQLCYVLGTTSWLNYASSTSGSITEAAKAMYSQYQLLTKNISKSKLTYSQWEELLYGELKKGYPVMCSGSSSDGHAFVLDGYDSETGLFHFNFGWGGSGDGYYPVDDSEESMGGYSKGQAVVYNIHPKNRNIEATLNFTYTGGSEPAVGVVSRIKNNSTLPIRQLYLYSVPANSTLEKTETAIWEGAGIENDGQTHTTEPATLDLSGNQRVTLYLTDEDKYVLAQYAFDIDDAIEDIASEGKGIHTYDLNGRRVYNSQKGVYIIDNGQSRKVIIK